MTWKKVDNASSGTADKFGGNDLDKISDAFSGVDVDDFDINCDFKIRSGKLQQRNPANTFSYIHTPAAIAGDRILNYPLLTGTDTIAVLGLAQTFTDVITIRKAQDDLIHLFRDSNGVGNQVGFFLDAKDSAGNQTTYSSLLGEIVDNTNGSEDGKAHFYVMIGGTLTRVATFDEFGNLRLGATNQRVKFKETGLTDVRDYTFPDVTTKLAGIDAAQTYSQPQTYTNSIIANGGFNVQRVSKVNTDSPYTASADDSTILIDASAGAFTLNLPAAASNAGKVYKIIRTDILSSTNLCTIDANASETIDGMLTWSLRPAEKLEIISNGTNWIVTWHNNPTMEGYYFDKGATDNRRYIAGQRGTLIGMLTTTTSPAANTLWALPFWVGRVTKFDTITFNITTSQASQNARAGIYADNGNMYPGALIFDTGSISTASTGAKDTTITSSLQIFQPGLYWLAWETSATTIQIIGLPNSTTAPVGFDHTNNVLTGAQAYGYSVSHTYGALPNPYTGGGTRLTSTPTVSNPVPALGLRPV